jgi:acyl-CoA hydrolase
MMDEVAFITATRFTRKDVTVSSDKIDFTKPIPAGYYRTYRHGNSYWKYQQT